jgi:hypothetical protein
MNGKLDKVVGWKWLCYQLEKHFHLFQMNKKIGLKTEIK